MNLMADSKVFVLPNDKTEYDFINVKLKGETKTLVLSQESVYEVREVGPASSFDVRPEPTFPSGESVKSIIFELPNDQAGFVKQSANMLTLTKYDVFFLVLCCLKTTSESQPERYLTSEDLIDEIMTSLGVCNARQSFQKIVVLSLVKICDTIDENGETYYRVNHTKIMDVLNRKVDRLQALLIDKKGFSVSSLIEESLGGLEALPSNDILQLQTLRWSVDYIFDSYLTQNLKDMYYSAFPKDFSTLDNFLAERTKQQKARAVVERNRSAVSNSKASSAKAEKTTKGTKKKPVKTKVAVGKGALDSFFSKKE